MTPTLGSTNDVPKPGLTAEQLEMLRAVRDVSTSDSSRHPGTDEVDRRRFEIRQRDGLPAFRGLEGRPRCGMEVVARQLAEAGLLEIHYSIASFRAPGAEIPTAERYFLPLTDAGREYIGHDAPPAA